MDTDDKHYRGTIRPLVIAGLCIVAAFALGQALQAPAQGQSPFESPTTRQHFLSGGERSEQVLREISATLKQIESRLARIERAALDAAQALQSLRDNQDAR